MYATKHSDKSKFYLQSARDPLHRRTDDHRHRRGSTSSSGSSTNHNGGSSSPELSSTELHSSNSDRRTSGRTTTVCSVCGKKYKHNSCLQKHMWEHHEAWDSCLKYNLTKHQQVQMMEAAQVLVNMMAVKLSR